MILYNNIFGVKSDAQPIKVTVEEIKTLAINSQLDINAVYQITDYQITNFINDKYSSTGHYFDILVTPYNNQKLNANAAATKHDGDTYYNEIDLRCWKLEYFIKDCTYGYEDNIIVTEFHNTNNPYGVITYLCDHSNNEAYFDFKNIAINGYKLFEGYDHIDYSQRNINGVSCVKNCSMLSLDYLDGIPDTESLVNLFPFCQNITLTPYSDAIIIHDNSVTYFTIINFTLSGWLKITEIDSVDIEDCRFIDNFRASTSSYQDEFSIHLYTTANVKATTIMRCSALTLTGYLDDMMFIDLHNKQIDGEPNVDIYQGHQQTIKIIS